MTYLWAAWAVSTSLLLIALYARSALQLRRMRPLSEAPTAIPDAWPTVSVLVPARNEVESIESALQSLRNQDYPALEIIVVDDRSDDGTGAIVDRMADEDERIRAVHVDSLPDGWLGKVHALHRAEAEASGEWLLLTDADVRHAPDVVRRTMAFANATNADHVTCVPRMRSESFWFQVCYAAFFLGTITLAPVRSVEHPDSDDYMGIGAYNLVRRSSLRAAGGFERLRLEIADDIGIGYLVSQQNGRTRILRAHDELDVPWYDSLSATVEGFEKNAFAAFGHFTYGRVLAFSAFWLVFATGPIAGLFAASFPVQMLSAGALATSLLYGGIAARQMRHPVAPFLLLYVGHWLMFYVLLHSTYNCWRRGGIVWRDTEYSLDELRSHQRVRL